MAKKRSPKWAEVICVTHGTKDIDRNWMPPVVKIPLPKTKRDRMSGCPRCAKLTPKLKDEL